MVALKFYTVILCPVLGGGFSQKISKKYAPPPPPIIFRNEKMAPLFNLTTVYRLNIYPNPGTPELGRQEGQLPLLPFTRKGKGGKGALSI
jgi:hypothetical protein